MLVMSRALPLFRCLALSSTLALLGPLPGCEKSESQKKPPAKKEVSKKKVSPPSAARAKAPGFVATVRIDPKPGGKKFQGVWLQRDDGKRLLIDYRARGLWRPFEGKRVRVTGTSYTPKGQAIAAAHFRVATMQMVDDKSTATLIWLGPEQKLEGKLSIRTGDPKSKMGGQSYPVFTTSGGTTYQLANSINTKPGPVIVTAREAKRSRFVTHMPGPLIWVLDTDTPRAR